MFEVAPGTIVVYSDIACPWSHLCVHRLWAAREELGLEGEVRFDHRAFPLELFNERATPKRAIDAEIAVLSGLEQDAGWHVWDRPHWEYPGTTLFPLEAVQAAKQQGLAASEVLDRALRLAFFRDRRNISLRHEVIAVAVETGGVDAEVLTRELDGGAHRREVLAQKLAAEDGRVKGSPHVFLADGTGGHNPGIETHLDGDRFPVIDKDDPSIYMDLLERARSGS